MGNLSTAPIEVLWRPGCPSTTRGFAALTRAGIARGMAAGHELASGAGAACRGIAGFGTATAEGVGLAAVATVWAGLVRAWRTSAVRSAWVGSAQLASFDVVVLVEGNAYFPMSAVRPGALTASRTTLVCPWKGIARYYYYAVTIEGSSCPTPPGPTPTRCPSRGGCKAGLPSGAGSRSDESEAQQGGISARPAGFPARAVSRAQTCGRTTVSLLERLHRLERRTRPTDPEFTAAMARRWAALPQVVKTPGQVLGRFAPGCEGTHGVFPACNLACTPCYHSRDANQVRVDGAHTRAQVQAQMAVLRRLRGPRAHAQLIGGEVTLLSPDDHAETLLIMRRHGREPMSMTHGDIDYDYLQQLVLGPDGKRRLDRVSFAAHFDKMMFGRRGIPRPPDEVSLHPYRRRFVDLFRRLRREHGVRFFLAHNMTVTPANVGEVAEVVRAVGAMGFGMLSFQPAAYVGDDRRWREDYRGEDVSPDAVWAQIERGAGTRLDYRVFENGDVRCNRTVYGFYLGDRWYPVLDGDDPRDLATRDDFFRYFSGIGFAATPAPLLVAKLGRLLARQPRVFAVTARWAARTARRVGVRALLRAVATGSRPRPVTFVMHQFMDAADVAPAWELMQQGITSDDPRLRETQERLAACHYAMGHPEDGTLVPACVQHSVLDPVQNAQLRTLLPLIEVRRSIRRGPAGAR
ncbi:MAG: DUF427 domain-containing protein [Sciscionella sp.]